MQNLALNTWQKEKNTEITVSGFLCIFRLKNLI